MKKVLSIVAVAALSVAFVSCGPSKEELEAKEKAKVDSIDIAKIDSIAIADALAADQAKVDSTAAAVAEQAKLDSLALATPAKKGK